MRTRNFRVWSGVVERGSVTKSQKGTKACVERKVGKCFQWKAHGQCSKGDSCSFSHDRLAQRDLCSVQRRKGRSSSPTPSWRPRLTNERQKSSKRSREDSSSDKKNKNPCRYKNCKIRHVDLGILSCVKTTSLRPDAFMEENVSSDMLRLRRCPANSKRKMVRKDQLLYWRNLHNWVVYLKILIWQSLFYVKKKNWDQNTPWNSPRAPGIK